MLVISKLVFACGEVLIVQTQHGETAEGIFCPDSSNNRHVCTGDLMSVELISAALWKHTNITSMRNRRLKSMASVSLLVIFYITQHYSHVKNWQWRYCEMAFFSHLVKLHSKLCICFRGFFPVIQICIWLQTHRLSLPVFASFLFTCVFSGVCGGQCCYPGKATTNTDLLTFWTCQCNHDTPLTFVITSPS